MINKQILQEMTIIDVIAEENTTCIKTYVGCSLGYEYPDGSYLRCSVGVNENREESCKRNSVCFRKKTFGTDSKEFRKFCRARHAEEVAINKLCKDDKPNTAIVTRYPCDACCDRLCSVGSIKRVYYGRPFEISEYAKEQFKKHNIEVVHVTEWECSDKNDTNR